jgi:hypothetical protein
MTHNFARMAANSVYALEKLLRESALGAEDLEIVRASLDHRKREYAILSGRDRLRLRARRVKWRLGALRRRLGLGAHWYAEPPLEVTAAFGDLSQL